jgi:hypothetical protein
MMLRVNSLRFAGAAALLLAMGAPAAAAGDPPQQAQQTSAPSDQTADTAAQPTEAAKPAKEGHKICRMVDSSESRLGAQRVCMTAAQWKNAQF